MIIDEVDVCRVLIVEFEYNSPVPGYGNRVLPDAIALQCMELKSWSVHRFRCPGHVQMAKDDLNPPRSAGRNAAYASRKIEALKSLVAEARYQGLV